MSVRADQLLDRFTALPAAAPLHDVLAGATADIWLVGGAVRDLALGGAPVDLDLLVEGEVGPLAARIAGDRPAAVRAHDRFATATATRDGFGYDIARARSERYLAPGALPEVAPARVADDLGRRDFTVNAMALAVAGPRRGELLAVDGALEDLRARVLRVLHAASFADDPTRLLRLARYGARLGFSADPETRRLAGEAVAANALQTVSGTRIGAELWLLAREADPVTALTALRDGGVDAALAPGFGLGAVPDDDGSGGDRPGEEIAAGALAALPPDGDPAALALAVAMLGVPAGSRPALLAHLGLPGGPRATILAASGRAPALIAPLTAAERPSQIAEAAGDERVETVALARALAPAGGGAENAATAWLQELRHVGLEISGDDLIAEGIASGPAVGIGLRAALAARLDGRAGDRRTQLAVAVAAALG